MVSFPPAIFWSGIIFRRVTQDVRYFPFLLKQFIDICGNSRMHLRSSVDFGDERVGSPSLYSFIRSNAVPNVVLNNDLVRCVTTSTRFLCFFFVLYYAIINMCLAFVLGRAPPKSYASMSQLTAHTDCWLVYNFLYLDLYICDMYLASSLLSILRLRRSVQ